MLSEQQQSLAGASAGVTAVCQELGEAAEDLVCDSAESGAVEAAVAPAGSAAAHEINGRQALKELVTMGYTDAQRRV